MPEAKSLSIALDVMGSDQGPAAMIQAARIALEHNWVPQSLLLVGDPAIISKARSEQGLAAHPKLEVQPASEVIEMHEKPIQSLKAKKDASLVRTIEAVKDARCAAAVSCGNTGALMACATLRLRPIEGVSKPALASVWPSRENRFIVLDVGANPQCRPENLAHYAVLGNAYARSALNITKPRVGLLSIGTEEGKGTDLTNAAHALLSTLSEQLHYVGLVEGFQLFNNEVDVVVTDGFTGNVILKTCESLWKMLKGVVTDEVRKSPVRMLGAVLMKNAFKDAKARLDPRTIGGAPLLGLRGTVLKAHGSSDAQAVASAIRIAGIAAQQDLFAQSVSAIARANSAMVGAQPAEPAH